MIGNKDKNENKTKKYIKNWEVLNTFLAAHNSKVPSGAKLILLMLLERLGTKEYCWPSLDTLAKATGLGVRQVEKHLKILRNQGYITWDKGGIFRGHNGEAIKRRSNKYHLKYFLKERQSKPPEKISIKGEL